MMIPCARGKTQKPEILLLPERIAYIFEMLLLHWSPGWFKIILAKLSQNFSSICFSTELIPPRW